MQPQHGHVSVQRKLRGHQLQRLPVQLYALLCLLRFVLLQPLGYPFTFPCVRFVADYNYPSCVYCVASTTCSGYGTCDVNTGLCICNANFRPGNCSNCLTGYWGTSCTGLLVVRWSLFSCVDVAPGLCRVVLLACPGGASTPCSNHGSCSQGLTGNGLCSCQSGYVGNACQVCFCRFVF